MSFSKISFPILSARMIPPEGLSTLSTVFTICASTVEYSNASVGYKTDYQMYSMDFEEFLWAKGYSEEAISDMLCHMLEGVAFSEAEQVIFSNLFLEYCILGGMPAIVSSYIERETFEGSLDLQHQLLVDYENDIVKYAQGLDKAKILSVYRSIPAQLAKENKKFQYSKVSKGGRSKDYMG